MAQVKWTPQAADDLDTIAEFISRDSPHYAGLLVADILQTADQLIDFPQYGRIVPEIGDRSLREIILGNYRIIYRLRSETAEILTVHHGARLLDARRLK